jgi:hypothetical protein
MVAPNVSRADRRFAQPLERPETKCVRASCVPARVCAARYLSSLALRSPVKSHSAARAAGTAIALSPGLRFDLSASNLRRLSRTLATRDTSPRSAPAAAQREKQLIAISAPHKLSSSIVIEELRAILADRVSTSESVREHHSHGESWHAPGLPDAVVFPSRPTKSRPSSRSVREHRRPIVPFGMGSSLEGHVNAIHGGVSIDLTRMTRVVRLSPEDLDITVEAG